eukprot:293999-Chlamydomonas_euryale.AAC.3
MPAYADTHARKFKCMHAFPSLTPSPQIPFLRPPPFPKFTSAPTPRHTYPRLHYFPAPHPTLVHTCESTPIMGRSLRLVDRAPTCCVGSNALQRWRQQGAFLKRRWGALGVFDARRFWWCMDARYHQGAAGSAHGFFWRPQRTSTPQGSATPTTVKDGTQTRRRVPLDLQRSTLNPTL